MKSPPLSVGGRWLCRVFNSAVAVERSLLLLRPFRYVLVDGFAADDELKTSCPVSCGGFVTVTDAACKRKSV